MSRWVGCCGVKHLELPQSAEFGRSVAEQEVAFAAVSFPFSVREEPPTAQSLLRKSTLGKVLEIFGGS